MEYLPLIALAGFLAMMLIAIAAIAELDSRAQNERDAYHVAEPLVRMRRHHYNMLTVLSDGNVEPKFIENDAMRFIRLSMKLERHRWDDYRLEELDSSYAVTCLRHWERSSPDFRGTAPNRLMSMVPRLSDDGEWESWLPPKYEKRIHQHLAA